MAGQTKRPSASSCRFVSISSAAERPSLAIVWRKRQIEAWSDVSTSNGKPAKRQPVPNRILSARIRQRVPLLQEQDLAPVAAERRADEPKQDRVLGDRQQLTPGRAPNPQGRN